MTASARHGYYGYVKKANIAEFKNRLSHYIEQVKRGETVVVVDRKTPVARLVPVPSAGEIRPGEERDWLLRMERKGVLRLGAGTGVPEIGDTSPPGKRPVGAVDALLEERRRR